MKIEEMLDIFDIDEIEKMSPEECKGLLKGFFIGAGFIKAIDEGISEAIENRYGYKSKSKISSYEPYKRIYNSYCSVQNRQDFRKIKLEFVDREEAKEVLDNLRDELELSKDGYVLVRTLYYLADLPINSIMREWGWYDLEDCEITREADHYILKMPPAERIREKDRASSIS